MSSNHATQTVKVATFNGKAIPSFDELPAFKNLPGCAWGVWNDTDSNALGTVNLLTDEVVKKSAAEEIRIGRSVSLNWPIQFPAHPFFYRKPAEVIMKPSPQYAVRDDEIHINTQSGSQWDGLKHCGIIEHNVFYNNIPASSMVGGIVSVSGPEDIDPHLAKIGIQNWATHGICGRGVLLDLVSYFRHTSPSSELPYDPWSSHAIAVSDLLACAAHQGLAPDSFRVGDILLLRMGFIDKYNSATKEERVALGRREETFAGIDQSDEMKRFLWNNHFAAVATDQPALERWPTPEGIPHLHQTLLGLWGMPMGEMFDLEALSQICAETQRWTFFFSSWPLNIIGGCASPPNAAAYF